MRRKWQAEQAECKIRHRRQIGDSKSPLSMQLGAGTLSSHPTMWATYLHRHCHAKYSLGKEDAAKKEQDLLDKLNDNVGRDNSSEEMEWTWSVTVQAQASMS